MNRIRAYFGRIQGRLAVAFLLAAFGMAGIAFITMELLGGYTGEIGDQVEALAARGNYALTLDNAISDQVSDAQDYLNTRRPQAKEDADSLGRLARQINSTYLGTPGVSSKVRDYLGSIRRVQAELDSAFIQAQREQAAGRSTEAHVQQMDRSLRALRALVRGVNTEELSNVRAQAAAIQDRAIDMQRLLIGLLAVTAIAATIFAYLTMKAIE